MALTRDAVSTSNASSGTQHDITHTIANQADRLLMVGIGQGSNPVAISSVVWDPGGADELALTSVINELNGADARAAIYRGVAPATGTKTLRVTLASGNEAVIGVVSYYGADQSTPLGTAVGAQGDSESASVTVSSAAGEIVFDVCAVEQTTDNITDDGDGDTLWDLTVGATLSGGSEEAGAASVTSSWTITAPGNDFAIVAVPIKPASSLSVNVDQASETDSGLAPTPTGAGTATRTVGQPSETDTALGVTVSLGNVNVVVGQASETDTALAVTPALGGNSVAVGQALETDSAFAVTPAASGVGSLALGLASETDSCEPVAPILGSNPTVDVGQAVETDSALSVVPTGAGNANQAVGQASQTDTALTISPRSGRLLTSPQRTHYVPAERRTHRVQPRETLAEAV